MTSTDHSPLETSPAPKGESSFEKWLKNQRKEWNQKWIDAIDLRISELKVEPADTIRKREITATIRELESLKEEMMG